MRGHTCCDYLHSFLFHFSLVVLWHRHCRGAAKRRIERSPSINSKARKRTMDNSRSTHLDCQPTRLNQLLIRVVLVTHSNESHWTWTTSSKSSCDWSVRNDALDDSAYIRMKSKQDYIHQIQWTESHNQGMQQSGGGLVSREIIVNSRWSLPFVGRNKTWNARFATH